MKMILQIDINKFLRIPNQLNNLYNQLNNLKLIKTWRLRQLMDNRFILVLMADYIRFKK